VIESMTGFGSSQKGPFKVEVRSVNHRFMDISIKIPQNLSLHEIPLRNLIKGRFSRGRFDAIVSVTGEEGHRVKLDVGIARELHQALVALKEELSLTGDIEIGTLAGFRDLILSEEIDYDAGPLFEAFNDALSRLGDMRDREGETIATDIFLRLARLEQMSEQIALFTPDAVTACKEKFIERLHDLFGEVQYDEGRVLQEAAIMAEKTDISEEITRVHSHVAQVKEILSNGDSVGRKIEFLLQELNREVNTVASKVNDYRITNLSIEIKAELEKMREQAQNLQ